jgi:hypothetical protein
MSEKNKSFGISFTDGKAYDLDKITAENDRVASDKPLLIQVVEEQPVEQTEGTISITKETGKIGIRRCDIKKYLYKKGC